MARTRRWSRNCEGNPNAWEGQVPLVRDWRVRSAFGLEGCDGDVRLAGDDFVWVGVDSDPVVRGGEDEADEPAPDSQRVQDALEAAALLPALQALRGTF